MYEAGVNKISLNFTPIPSTSKNRLAHWACISTHKIGIIGLRDFPVLLFCLFVCHLFLDTTSASEICHVVPPNENMPEPGEAPVTQSPKSLNLAGLKAAFSSHHSSNSGNKSGVGKAANSGSTQKTLQTFFKGTVKPATCNPSTKSPLKPTRDLATCSPVGKSVLDGFRYGRTGTDSEKGGCDVTMATADTHCRVLESSSPEPVADRPSVKNETFEETSDNSHTVPEDPDAQTEPCSSNEDRTVSPDAKRARTEKPHFPTELKSDTFSNSFERSSSTVDAPGCLQRRTMPLQFSLQELAAKMKRLQDQRKQRASDDLRYRRFRAKINPGENQSAEEELKKEIR